MNLYIPSIQPMFFRSEADMWKTLRDITRAKRCDDDTFSLPLFRRDAVLDENFFKLIAFDGFLFCKFFRDSVECCAMLADNVFCSRLCLVYDARDFCVYLCCDMLRIRFVPEMPVAKGDWPQLIAHSVTSHHFSRERGDNHEVVTGPGRHIAEEHLFGDVAAKGRRDV